MTNASREQVWNRIMAVQEEFNRLEEGFASIPQGQISWWIRWRFKKALDSMVEARGAHSHGELAHISEGRLPRLELAARTYSKKLAEFQRAANERV